MPENPPLTPPNPEQGSYGAIFPEVLAPRPCSAQSCSAGHSWPPVIATTKCPGCGAPILVLKMLNCPICNEPSSGLRLRTDHLPQGGTITPVCKGSASMAEIIEVVIEQQHSADEEKNHKERTVISKI